MTLLSRFVTNSNAHGLLLLFWLGLTTWAMAQQQPQPEKRWVRLGFIEVARKSLADSIVVQWQKGVAF